MYGQQITPPEPQHRIPSIFNNTVENLTITNRIPITIILDQKKPEPIQPPSPSPSPSPLSPPSLPPPPSQLKSQLTYYHNKTGDFHVSLGGSEFSSIKNDITSLNNSSSTMLKTDRIFDVYLESLTTLDAKANTSKENMAFKLNIKDWNIDNYSNVNDINNFIIIPNEATSNKGVFFHKSKKLNYITHLVPDKISKISGNLSMLRNKGSTTDNPTNVGIFYDEVDTNADADANADANGSLILELILIPRNKN